jgi:glucose/arabinose dehydrogenase
VFDGRGHAFITTGEHSRAPERVLAQDIGTTYGKVVRVNLDGVAPADNPLVGKAGIDTIWSWGHRNVQGAAMDAAGRLWTIEHGPMGGDELNRPEPGRNYGWPVVGYGINYNGDVIGEGIARAEGMEEPVYFWDPVIAPSGMQFYSGAMFPEWEGNLLIGSLSGALVRLVIEGDRVVGEERLLTDVGRIRDVEVAADGSLMILIDDAEGQVMRVTRD